MGFMPYTYNRGPAEGDDGQRARVEENVRRAREHWVKGHEAREAAIAVGPALRDTEAAADCPCSCHPRPATLDFHAGGAACPCQLTEEEHTKIMGELFGALRATEGEHLAETHSEFLRELSDELDADIWEEGGAAPYVVRGIVDGRFFYLRERHDMWRVEVAPDDDPLRDIWMETLSSGGVIVAEGSSVTLYDDDPKTPTRRAVEAVRVFLTRRSCVHADAQLFCPSCGVKMTESEKWAAPEKRDVR